MERLCSVLAMTTLYSVSQGTSVVKRGKRRLVDSHRSWGTSYLKIGWKWVSYALSRGYELLTSVYLSSECDPEPAIASKNRSNDDKIGLPLSINMQPEKKNFEFCQSTRSISQHLFAQMGFARHSRLHSAFM